MKNNLLVAIVGLTLVSCTSTPKEEKKQMIAYPDTKAVDVVDDYFGTKVSDPYRWLENDTSKETEAWVLAQNKVTSDYLNQIPYRDKIAKRYEEIFNYEKVGAPSKVGEYYFFSKNDGLQNQSVYYYKKGKKGEPMVFIDPNTLSSDGTLAIGLMGASNDDKYMAYSVNEAGSDWQKIKIRDIATNTDLEDELQWVKFSGASWLNDGFFYSRYPAPNEGEEFSATNQFHSVYYHKLGDPQANDKLIFSDENVPNMYHYGGTTEDDKYFILYRAQGTDGYECYYKNIEEGLDADFVKLFTGFANKSSIVDHNDGKFLVRTDIDAPNYRLVSIDLSNPAKENWTEVIPQNEHLLEGVGTAGKYMFASYLENAATQVYQYNMDGSLLRKVEMPGVGTAGGFGGKKEDTEVFYYYTSFNYPTSIFSYQIESGESEVFFKPNLKFNPEDYESKQVFFSSKDGTKIPVFIVHKKGLKLDGTNPTLLYGYGGFNVSLSPSFSTSNIVLLENGGIYALAILRGGGEFGEEWHQSGMLLNKQNVFDDFIGAGEFLIKEGYTSKEKLAIRGGSNGGLLVGACMTQRPELFKVAFPAVGVMDMLRYHKFTVGWGWIPEYGCADSSEADFKNLYGYSPLHTLKPAAYPATMVTTADHDDRVVPAHSFKFAAQLQKSQTGKAPVMIRIETKAGHGAGKPTSKVIEEQADLWSFMFYNMGMKDVYNEKEKK